MRFIFKSNKQKINAVVKIFLVFFGIFLGLLCSEILFYANERFGWIKPKAAVNDPNLNKNKINSAPLSADAASLQRSYQDFIFTLNDPFEKIRAMNLGTQELSGEENSNGENLLKLNPSGVTLANFFYRTDKYGRRITLGAKDQPNYLLMLGDSFVFGNVLAEEFTLPSFLQTRLKQHRVYNLGVGGSAPNDYISSLENTNELARQKFGTLFDAISGDDGILVYYMTDFSLRRVVCTAECFYPQSKAKLQRESYILNNKGKLQTAGKFSQRNDWPYAFYRLAGNSPTIRFFYRQPELLNETHSKEILIHILNKLKENISLKMNVNKFLFVWRGTMEDESWLKLPLENNGWQFYNLDPEIFNELDKYRSIIPYENHPSPQQNWIASRLLEKKLKELNWVD